MTTRTDLEHTVAMCNNMIDSLAQMLEDVRELRRDTLQRLDTVSVEKSGWLLLDDNKKILVLY